MVRSSYDNTSQRAEGRSHDMYWDKISPNYILELHADTYKDF